MRESSSVTRALGERVRIVNHDPRWARLFEAESHHLRSSLPRDSIGRIEHFGSTAVPGLAAKPIIDMLVEVPSLDLVHQCIAPILQSQGYEYFWRPSWHDPLRPEYAWFIKRDRHGLRTHHIHMLTANSPDWERLLFRDALIANPDLAQEYAHLKRSILETHPDDRVAYARAKTDFIVRVTEAARNGKIPTRPDKPRRTP